MSLHEHFHRAVAPVVRRPATGTNTSDLPPQPVTIERGQPTIAEGFVTDLVAQHDAIPQASRSGGNTNGYLHVSSLIGMCPREQAISRQYGTPVYSTVSGAMKIVWKIGRAVEKHIRDGVIQSRDWHGVFGLWTCRCHRSTHLGLYPRNRTCPVCDGHLKNYREPLLTSHEHGIVGSPDITLVEVGFHFVVEIKSMTKDDFDALTKPLADHVLQAMCYRRLYKLAGYQVTDIVSIVYGRKDFKFGGPKAVYKEYHVRASDWDGQVDQMFAAARQVKEANRTGVLPDRVCDAIDCRRSRNCERSNLCWSL